MVRVRTILWSMMFDIPHLRRVMIEKTLATFKIEVRQWELFKTKATSADSNATKTILDLIAAYLDDRVSIAPNIEESTIALIDEQIATAISPLLVVITEMQADIEVLKSDRVNQPKSSSQNDLQQTLDHRAMQCYLHQKASNIPLETSVVKPALGMGRAVCSHCGSSELVKKGRSESKDKKEGLTGRRVKCKSCGMASTLWEAKY